MAGFEVVVRPVVFPNIRPAPARSLPPEDDPEKGICVIKGGGSFPVQLSHSANVSTSKSKPVETERRVDEVRVFQEEDDGTVNKDNFIDVEVANRITMRHPPSVDTSGPGSGTPGVGSTMTYEDEVSYYRKIDEDVEAEEKKNKEIRERDKVKKRSGLEQAR